MLFFMLILLPSPRGSEQGDVYYCAVEIAQGGASRLIDQAIEDLQMYWMDFVE